MTSFPRMKIREKIYEKFYEKFSTKNSLRKIHLRKILYEKFIYEKFSCFFLQAYGIFNYCRGTCGPQSRPDRGAGLEVAMFH